MIGRDSRYRRVPAFDPDARTDRPMRVVRPRVIGAATGIIEHTVRSEDRLDELARVYYGDASLWWRIVDANPEFLFAGTLLADCVGNSILIPRAVEGG